MQIKTYIRFLAFLVSLCVVMQVEAQRDTSSGKPAKAISRSYGRSGVLFDVAVYYGQTEATANPVALNQWQYTTSIYDIKLGYVMDNSVYLGADYTTRSDNQVYTSNTSGNSTGLGTGYFFDSGFNLRAYYKFGETYGNYSDGTGYQADLGYMVNMTSNFFLGFVISVRQTTFKSNGTITGFDFWTRKETYPFLTVGFLIN
ncbi:hypothetical protein K2P97_10820 [bacterium]|nr:hypothetical protein [bacterium]